MAYLQTPKQLSASRSSEPSFLERLHAIANRKIKTEKLQAQPFSTIPSSGSARAREDHSTWQHGYSSTTTLFAAGTPSTSSLSSSYQQSKLPSLLKPPSQSSRQFTQWNPRRRTLVPSLATALAKLEASVQDTTSLNQAPPHSLGSLTQNSPLAATPNLIPTTNHVSQTQPYLHCQRMEHRLDGVYTIPLPPATPLPNMTVAEFLQTHKNTLQSSSRNNTNVQYSSLEQASLSLGLQQCPVQTSPPLPTIESFSFDEDNYVPQFKDDSSILTSAEIIEKAERDPSILNNNGVVNFLLGTIAFERCLNITQAALGPSFDIGGTNVDGQKDTTEEYTNTVLAQSDSVEVDAVIPDAHSGSVPPLCSDETTDEMASAATQTLLQNDHFERARLIKYLNNTDQTKLRGTVKMVKTQDGQIMLAREISNILRKTPTDVDSLNRSPPPLSGSTHSPDSSSSSSSSSASSPASSGIRNEENKRRASQSSHYHKTAITLIERFRELTVRFGVASWLFLGPALDLKRLRVQPWPMFCGCDLTELMKLLRIAAETVEEALKHGEKAPSVLHHAGFDIAIFNIYECPLFHKNETNHYPPTYYRPRLEIFKKKYPTSQLPDSNLLLPYFYNYDGVRDPQWRIEVEELPYSDVQEFVDPKTGKRGPSRRRQLDRYYARQLVLAQKAFQQKLVLEQQNHTELPPSKHSRKRGRPTKNDIGLDLTSTNPCPTPTKAKRAPRMLVLDQTLYPPTARYFVVRTSTGLHNHAAERYKFFVGSHAQRLSMKQTMRDQRNLKALKQRNQTARKQSKVDIQTPPTDQMETTSSKNKQNIRLVMPRMSTKRRSRFGVMNGTLVRIIPTVGQDNSSRNPMLKKKIKSILFALRRLAIQCDIPIFGSIVFDKQVYIFHHGNMSSILEVYDIAAQLLKQKHDSLNGVEAIPEVASVFDVRLWTTQFKNVAGEHGSSQEYIPWVSRGAFMDGTTMAIQNVHEEILAPEQYGPVVPDS